MNEDRDSITGLVFHVLGGLVGAVALVCMVSKVIPPFQGLSCLMSALVLWWMGDIVALLKAISHDLRQRQETRPAASPANAAQQHREQAQKPPTPSKHAGVYKLD